MYDYKTAKVETAELTAIVDLTLTGNWKARNTDDHNLLCDLPGLEAALSRALESDDGVGENKKQTVTVTVSK